MKTILIESVSNGWLVRPFQPCETWAVKDRPEIAVFNNMDDLQKAIPELLEWTPGITRQQPDRNEHDNSALSQA